MTCIYNMLKFERNHNAYIIMLKVLFNKNGNKKK